MRRTLDRFAELFDSRIERFRIGAYDPEGTILLDHDFDQVGITSKVFRIMLTVGCRFRSPEIALGKKPLAHQWRCPRDGGSGGPRPLSLNSTLANGQCSSA